MPFRGWLTVGAVRKGMFCLSNVCRTYALNEVCMVVFIRMVCSVMRLDAGMSIIYEPAYHDHIITCCYVCRDHRQVKLNGVQVMACMAMKLMRLATEETGCLCFKLIQ